MDHTVGSGRAGGSSLKKRLKTGVLCSFTVLAAPAASTCGPPPVVDITGTWVAKVATAGSITVPVSPTPIDATIQTTLRLNITKSGTNYVHKIELCKLDTPAANNALI